MTPNIYLNTYTGVMLFVSTLAQELSTQFGAKVTPINFDAHAEQSTFPPDGDLVGFEGLSMNSPSDSTILSAGSVVLTCGTQSDINNERITAYINYLFDLCQPLANEIGFVDNQTGEKLGYLLVHGQTQLLPVDNTSTARTYQSIGIQFSVISG